jgi:hypothetical protein
MLRRISLMADNPPKPWRLHTEALQRPGGRRRVFHGDTAGLPVGLHGWGRWEDNGVRNETPKGQKDNEESHIEEEVSWRALENYYTLSWLQRFQKKITLIFLIFQWTSYLCNRFLIDVIRDFWIFSEIPDFFLDKKGSFC